VPLPEGRAWLSARRRGTPLHRRAADGLPARICGGRRRHGGGAPAVPDAVAGAVNYVAVSEALGVSLSALAAGLAADNIICTLYFTGLFALASKIPA